MGKGVDMSLEQKKGEEAGGKRKEGKGGYKQIMGNEMRERHLRGDDKGRKGIKRRGH